MPISRSNAPPFDTAAASGPVCVTDPTSARRASMCRSLSAASVVVWAAPSIAEVLASERLPSTRVVVIGAPVDGAMAHAVRDLRRRAPATSILAVVDELPNGSPRESANPLAEIADDVVRAACVSEELVMRVRTLLRRTGLREQFRPLVLAPQWLLDVPGMRILFQNQSIPLTPREFSIVALLARARGAVVSRRDLLATMSGPADQTPLSENALEARIAQLRKKLARIGLDHHLQTVRNAGYRLSLPSLASLARYGDEGSVDAGQ